MVGNSVFAHSAHYRASGRAERRAAGDRQVHFANKVGGIVITGDEDGAEHIIGNILNFMSWNGFSIPPAPSVTFLGDASEDTKESLKKKFKRRGVYDSACTFARNEAYLARLLKENPFPEVED